MNLFLLMKIASFEWKVLSEMDGFDVRCDGWAVIGWYRLGRVGCDRLGVRFE